MFNCGYHLPATISMWTCNGWLECFRVPFSCRFGGMLCEELYYSGACQVAITSSTSSVIVKLLLLLFLRLLWGIITAWMCLVWLEFLGYILVLLYMSLWNIKLGFLTKWTKATVQRALLASIIFSHIMVLRYWFCSPFLKSLFAGGILFCSPHSLNSTADSGWPMKNSRLGQNPIWF